MAPPRAAYGDRLPQTLCCPEMKAVRTRSDWGVHVARDLLDHAVEHPDLDPIGIAQRDEMIHVRIGYLIRVMRFCIGENHMKCDREISIVVQIGNLLMAREPLRQHGAAEGDLARMICQIFPAEFQLFLNRRRGRILQRDENVMVDHPVRIAGWGGFGAGQGGGEQGCGGQRRENQETFLHRNLIAQI